MSRSTERGQRAELTISSKRQITLPAAMIRRLELEPGDKLVVRLEIGSILLQGRSRSLVEYLDSFSKGVSGCMSDELYAYLAEGCVDRYVTVADACEVTV